MKLVSSEPDIRTLVQRIDYGDIDLQPDFQRQEVWSTRKKKKLIDTILRGWSIPPVHLVETLDGQAEVLDGQQRLAALRDFLHNKFSIDGNITPEDPDVKSLHGKFFRNLDEKSRRKVEQYPLRCFRIIDYLPPEPNELFYRLNQPTMLTSGEQRNALFGPARAQLKELVVEFESNNGKGGLGFSNLRLAYDDIIARLLYFVEAGNFGVKSTESRISDRFREPRPFADDVFETCKYSIDAFSVMREAARPYRYNKASVLSWLLFLSRFASSGELDPTFLDKFIEATVGEVTENYVSEATALFDDRASSRVTDVSSVVYRDFSLNYCFYYLISSDKLPSSVLIDAIRITCIEREIGDYISLEAVLEENLSIEHWSESL